MDSIEAVVIGGGVVGLACARALALAGREVILVEAGEAIGTGTSSRNSEVIHAGIYYPPGSLKARLCVEGKGRLYAYARERGIPARAIGKLIVATDEAQRPGLAALKDIAERNGVHDLAWLDADAVRALEPEVAGVAALHSPSSGIVDSHALMLSFQGDLEAGGGLVALHAPVLGVRHGAAGFEVEVGGSEPMTLSCRTLVNAAGHAAPDLARGLRGGASAPVPRAYLAKGNYYALSGVRAPFKRLVYPMPEAAGLGIHATIDLGGQVRFGPDVEWVDRLDYAVNPDRGPAFAQAIRRYWPGLPDGALIPTYAGIRPKISGPGEPAADFLIQGPETHGIPGLVDLLGIESPGLTASLAIADHVEGLLAARPAG